MKTDTKSRLFVFAIWLAVIALLGAYIYSLVIADNNTRSALISVIAFIAVTAITLRSNKQREIDAKHRKHKAEGYRKYIDIFIDMGGKHRKLSDKKFEESVLEFKKTLLTWGSEETIKTWNILLFRQPCSLLFGLQAKNEGDSCPREPLQGTNTV